MSSPLFHLTMARIREFYREPAAVFWVYCFPILMAVALGIAFREKPIELIIVDVRTDVGSAEVAAGIKAKLQADSRFQLHEVTGDDWQRRLRSGKTNLVLVPTATSYELWDEPIRSESVLAKHAVLRVLQGEPKDAPTVQEHHLDETGSRYIDFLLPGLLGMNLMGGGLFGVGFVLADMRVRKLMKRFIATPMRRRDFLLSVVFSRMLFTVPEVVVILLFGYFAFGVKTQGNALALVALIILGAASFGGLGLLIASRAKTIETVSGLLNLCMLPMYLLSGVFFSAERFPDFLQPFIQILPLTAMNNALRGVMLDGKTLVELGFEIAVLAVWGLVSFVVALKIFRWQ